MIKEIKPGEIIYGNCTIQYRLKKKVYVMELFDQVIARKYESKFPQIENSDLIVGKLKTKKNQRQDLQDIKYLKIEIKQRTGFIMKYDKNRKHSTGTIEKQTRLENGTYV
tara:strand:+ start:1415 stop:1744 length:330 start_codon:yes stop_codon:yes gene_type:complete